MNTQPKVSVNKPLVDLQVYQPAGKPPAKKPEVNPAMYVPVNVENPYFPPQMNPMWPYYTPNLVNPVIKQYSVNNGPFTSYTSLESIKEDSLPKQLTNTANTLGERLNIHNFIRSVFIKQNDGEDIDLDGKGNNSLMSYLKFMELNPYSSYASPMNPYLGLPDDMLVYRSCYPIRFDDKIGTVQCAPNSMGVNIRIYKLRNSEYNVRKLETKDYENFDVWREIAYYEYIREEILKRKVCPNFVMLYCYYIVERCNINFDKVKQLKERSVAPFVKGSRQPSTQEILGSIFPHREAYNGPKTKSFAEMLEENSGRGLVALTEAPTYNLDTWASKTYKTLGNVQKMINTGYHSKEVWMSVLFQLMVILYVMQLHGIAFNKFTLEDHIYIKDISQHENITTYWKYKIKGYEFYVPNYGFLVQLDSNYKDVIPSSTYTVKKISDPTKHKIFSNIFNDTTPQYDSTSIKNSIFNIFQSVMNPNTFSNAFTNKGGSPPPAEILQLLTAIHNASTATNANTDIGSYFGLYMGKLLNNRVGTFLTELEIKKIQRDDNTAFEEGQIVVHQIQNQQFAFVVFVSQNNNIATVLTKINPTDQTLSVANVDMNLLFNYSKLEPILQNYKPMEANLNDDELLETYIVA